MGRIPKPDAPYARGLPIFPTPAPADYSDEVTEKDIAVLSELVGNGDCEDNKDEWELVDGPGW